MVVALFETIYPIVSNLFVVKPNAGKCASNPKMNSKKEMIK